ncbi:hypothetical protein E2I00_010696, partial [Balaenoptera physalus]
EWADACCRGLRSVHAYILVYDICCFDSFEYVKTIRQQILETRVIGTSETPIIIVGNKRDLQRGRVIPRWNVSHLVRKTWKCGYVECSAKYNWHILLLFSELLKSVGCARCKHGSHFIQPLVAGPGSFFVRPAFGPSAPPARGGAMRVAQGPQPGSEG